MAARESADLERLVAVRVAHVVSLVSPDGAYGGPLTVALDLAREMQRQGHQVELFAGYRGPAPAPVELDGVRAHLHQVRRALPGLGFAGIVAPGLRRSVLRGRFDVVHVHLARDLITLPIAAALRRNHAQYVVQTHGMVDRSSRRLARILDAAVTRRVLRGASAVFHLDESESRELVHVARTPDIPLERLPNGIAAHEVMASPADSREVLFVARLAPRKRPDVFVEAARLAHERGADARFTLIGPDEGEGQRVRERIHALGAGEYVRWAGPIAPADVLTRMAQASVFVLPAVDEPWGMSVLEAMSVGLPAVVTPTCGIARAVQDPNALIVADDESPHALAEHIVRLMADPQRRVDVGRRARREAQGTFGIDAVAERAIAVYAGARDREGRGRGMRL